MARPKLDIDPKVVETLAKVGATNCEIADHFGCDEGTIRKRFSELLDKSRATRKIKLREMQWKLAEKGNLGMLIWLGKQELGQSEKVEQKQETKISGTMVTAMTPEQARELLNKMDGDTNGKSEAKEPNEKSGKGDHGVQVGQSQVIERTEGNQS